MSKSRLESRQKVEMSLAPTKLRVRVPISVESRIILCACPTKSMCLGLVCALIGLITGAAMSGIARH